MIRVLVAASSAIVRAGLESILARDPTITVIGGEGGNVGTSLVEEVAEHEPDVVLLERASVHEDLVSLSGVGTDVGVRPPALVVLTDDVDGASLASLVRQGARAILPRAANVVEILAAVSGAAAGLVSVPAEWVVDMLPRINGTAGASTRTAVHDSPALTPRELDVLRLVAEGLANKQIASRLGISDHTVKFHVASLFTKLHAATRAEAVARGARRGLIVL